jgi:hypothetical protein
MDSIDPFLLRLQSVGMRSAIAVVLEWFAQEAPNWKVKRENIVRITPFPWEMGTINQEKIAF